MKQIYLLLFLLSNFSVSIMNGCCYSTKDVTQPSKRSRDDSHEYVAVNQTDVNPIELPAVVPARVVATSVSSVETMLPLSGIVAQQAKSQTSQNNANSIISYSGLAGGIIASPRGNFVPTQEAFDLGGPYVGSFMYKDREKKTAYICFGGQHPIISKYCKEHRLEYPKNVRINNE